MPEERNPENLEENGLSRRSPSSPSSPRSGGNTPPKKEPAKPAEKFKDLPLTSSEYDVYDTEASAKGKGRFNLKSDLIAQIGVAAIVSVVVMLALIYVFGLGVTKSTYTNDITRLETDLVNMRGAGYAAGDSIANLRIGIDTANQDISRLQSASTSYLVQGDLENYYTKSDVDSKITSVRNSVPSAADIANQASTQIDTKLAAVDVKMATVDAKIASLGNSSPLEYKLIGIAPDYQLKVKSSTAGKYAARVILSYPVPIALASGNMTDAVVEFYGKLVYPNRNFIPSLIYSSGWKLAQAEFYTPSFLLEAGVERTFTMPIVGLQIIGVQEVYIEIIKSCETTSTTGGGSI